MKQQIELTCATCGATFIAEADYFIPGVSGFATDKSGEIVNFIDPTAEHHCKLCVCEAVEVILRKERDYWKTV